MKQKHYPYVGKGFRDRHGKIRYRFRRKGYPERYINAPYGTKAFEQEYAACVNGGAKPGQRGGVKAGHLRPALTI